MLMLHAFDCNSTQVLTFRVPPFYSLIVRTLTILEGLALFVDPDFRLIKVQESRALSSWPLLNCRRELPLMLLQTTS